METEKSDLNSEERFAFNTGFMTALSAIKDCASSTGNTSLKEAAKLIGESIKLSEVAFMAGVFKAVLISLEAKNDKIANQAYIEFVHDMKE